MLDGSTYLPLVLYCTVLSPYCTVTDCNRLCKTDTKERNETRASDSVSEVCIIGFNSCRGDPVEVNIMATSASEEGSALYAYHDHEANDVEMKTLDWQHRETNDNDETQFMLSEGSMRETEAEEKRNIGRWNYFRKLLLFSVLVSIATALTYLHHPISANDSKVAVWHQDASDGAMELNGATLAQSKLTSVEPTYFPTKALTTPSPVSVTAEPTYFPSQGTIEPESTVFETKSDVKRLQISNYIAGKSLILNIHITHHAGTSVCVKMSELGPTPSFACMKNKSGDKSPWPANDPNINKFSISYHDFPMLVRVFRPYFHFMSMEYPRWGNLHHANWEYENLVSLIVMRNPLDRFLAGGKCGGFHNSAINEADPEPSEEVQRLFWEYANDRCADNYALRVLANTRECNEQNMNECFESAKSLLERFTFILDEDCLDEGMETMGAQLHLGITRDSFESHLHHEHKSAQERINNDTLYEFLLEKFHYDIALYEWSKNISIVKCADLINPTSEKPTLGTSSSPEEEEEDRNSHYVTAEPTYFPSISPVELPIIHFEINEDTVQPHFNASSDAIHGQKIQAYDNSSDVKQLQISNYIAGKSLILNIHITHHAGTSVCAKMSELGPTPSFACMKNKSGDNSSWPANDPNINTFSLSYDDAPTLVRVFRPYFHFMSMEYSRWGNLHHANWEYENLVSLIVMRNPLDRFLAGGKCGRLHNSAINEADPEPSEEVQRLFWEYANDRCADNYALRVLANTADCNEQNMNECFESAKSLLERFTFILDEDCLNEGMEAMSAQLHLGITRDSFESRLHHGHNSAQERINNDTLYEFLLEKFHYDIALYEWSKNMSIVRCNGLAKP
eukprot:CCRYP_000129-RA/>CCRYP_000129-RA protein AED:0.04 eAED:0.02 QI:0/1/0.33/1/1/1/3/15/851